MSDHVDEFSAHCVERLGIGKDVIDAVCCELRRFFAGESVYFRMLSPSATSGILSDYKNGETSIRQLAKKHGVTVVRVYQVIGEYQRKAQ